MSLVKKKKSLNFYSAKSVPTAIKHKNKNIFYKNCKNTADSFTFFVKKYNSFMSVFFLFQKISGEKSLIQLKEKYSWHDFCYMYGRNNLNNPTIKEFDHE